MKIDELHKLEKQTKNLVRTATRITEKHITDDYVSSWITEAEELYEIYGDELLNRSFVERLNRIKKHGPDKELIQRAEEYIDELDYDIDLYRIKYIEQIRNILQSDIPQSEKNKLFKWRTGFHGESGLGYRLISLLRTESNAAQSIASVDVYKDAGIKKYKYIAYLDDKTCDPCMELNGQTFYVKDAERGVNLPPMHPNCRCFTVPVRS